MRKLVIIVSALMCVLSASVTASADVRVPRLFGDNMILQQQTHNAAWGWADADETVTVKASWGTADSATAGPDGKWMLFLETPGTGRSLTIRGKNTIEIENVAIGEVAATVKYANGLAPEITDLNAEDVSYALEAKLPDLEKPFINTTPADRRDGIAVGQLGVDGGNKDVIVKFAEEIAAGKYGAIDSLLLHYKGKLLFESYFRRGRINYPHFQMSITKSYTALAIGRAIALGHLTMDDLDKPVVSFLKKLDQSRLAAGAASITVAEAMNMRSGIRLARDKVNRLRRASAALRGQGQIQAYLGQTAPIPTAPRAFKYQGSDPSMAMQVLETVVPGSARAFIQTELLGKLGITNFAWQNDVSGFPKSAAGSSICSRDMMKVGILVAGGGKWNDEQLIPEAFVGKATSRLYTNPQGTSYGYFWWRHNMTVGKRKFDCRSARGAGGQFILILPELDLIAVVTSHNKGMGTVLATIPERVLPAFIQTENRRKQNQ